MTARFKTSDNKFLLLHSGTTSETLFSWTIHLKQSILAERCSHRVTPYRLEIHLLKKEQARWAALERAVSKAGTQTSHTTTTTTTNTTSSTGSGTSSNWLPISAANSSLPGRDKESKNAKVVVSSGVVGGAKSVDAGTDSRNQKPTCAVPPQSHRPGTSQLVNKPEPEYNPGFTGLDNLGNTCFMNSVLQVLANTVELKDYMLDVNMKSEINYSNPLGTGGTLILTFAVLMRSMWSGKFRSCAPSKLKSTIASKASQFMGFAQHDAQEFMAFLLDGLHEDLNRVKKKPYIEAQGNDGKADEDVAEEAWELHKKRNDSFIVDLFQGQYKSKLVCPVCGKVSITFDPFMHLSVPLPKKKKRILPVYFFYNDYYRKPVKFVVALSTDATVEELKSVMGEKTGVHPQNLRVFEMYRSRVQKIFSPTTSLTSVSYNDIIFVCEVLSSEQSGEEVQEVVVMQRMMMPPPVARCSYCRKERESNHSLKHCTKCYRVGYCDPTCQKKHWPSHKMTCHREYEPVGCPFVISLPTSRCTYSRICRAMEAYARYSTNIFQPPVLSTTAKPPIPCPNASSPTETNETIRVTPPHEGQDDADRPVHSSQGVEQQEEEEAMDVDTTTTSTDRVITDNKGAAVKKTHRSNDGANTATVHGQPQLPERVMPSFFIKPVNKSGQGLHGSSGERITDKGDTAINLKQYNLLAMDWRNDPKQQNHILVESKSLEYEDDDSLYEQYEDEKSTTLDHCLNLFTEPERLAPDEAWYCPQCKEHREATKQMSLWRLPSSLIIQLKRFSFKTMIWRDKIDKMIRYPIRGLDLTPYCHGVKGTVPPVYDLYGVINHHGGILGGHYTTIARLPSRESWMKNEYEWRLFDDSHVSYISEKNVTTQSAYLLFYRLRQPYIPYTPQPLLTAEDQEGEAVRASIDVTKPDSATLVQDSGVSGSDKNRPHDTSIGNNKESKPTRQPTHREKCSVSSTGKCEDVPYTDMEDID